MPKPIAIVTASIRAQRARVTVETPDPAHTAAAIEAARSTSAWCRVGTYGVVVEQPPAAIPGQRRTYGGGAEAEQVRYIAQDARDAAKAALRALGYTVRATHPATTETP